MAQMLTDRQVEQAASTFIDARRNRTPIEGLPETHRPTSLGDAYRIQRAFDRLRGEAVAGYKIGAASAASQKLVGASGPFLASMRSPDYIQSPATLRRSDFFQPGVEAEYAFEIGKDLPVRDGGYDRDMVERAIVAVYPVIEICDNRFRNWRSTDLMQIVADNGFFGALVVGERFEAWRTINLGVLAVSMSVNGTLRGQASCRDVLGDPLDGVLWMANELSKQGIALSRGQIVPIGTWTGLHFIAGGETVHADFGPLGAVALTFRRD